MPFIPIADPIWPTLVASVRKSGPIMRLKSPNGSAFRSVLRLKYPVDREYFETKIEPLLDHPLVEFLGEITDAEKCDFLGEAAAVLCTYDWPEPFGIVLIEALACGTPVFAYRRGSIPEIIEDGVTGFICENLDEMVAAIDRLPLIQRQHCRDSFEARFTVQRMVQDYLALYERMAAAARPRTHINGRASGLLHGRQVTATELVTPHGTA